MKKNKLLVSSLLATLMSISLIGGATYSLFTSTKTHDITVSSATVEISSEFGKTLTFSSTLEKGENNTGFTNGGKAEIDTVNGNIKITGMTPGDKLGFTLKVTNNSDVKIKYRVRIVRKAEDALNSSLELDGAGAETWADLNPGQSPEDTNYTLTFVNGTPENDNPLQGLDTTVQIIVEAHQYNDPALQDYSITLDPKGGNVGEGVGKTKVITQMYGTKVEKPVDPTLEGHDFAGWYTDEACTEPNKFTFDENTTMPMKNITLYAKWTLAKYTITLVPGDGASLGDNVNNTITADYNSQITLPEPTKDGFTFLGWFKDETTKFTSTTMPAGSTTLTAHWEKAPEVGAINYTFNNQSNSYTATSLTEEGEKLSKITIPATYTGSEGTCNVTGIGERFVLSNTALKEVVIPDTILKIDLGAFAVCTNLSKVTFGPNSQLETIGPMAFLQDNNITSFKLPSKVSQIGDQAFLDTGLKSFVFNDVITAIPSECFSSRAINFEAPGLFIPKNIKTIGKYAFNRAKGIINFQLEKEEAPTWVQESFDNLTINYGQERPQNN